MNSLVSGDSPLDEIPIDATLLISGPPMTGKYDLLLTVLARSTDSAIVISTKHQAARVVDDYRTIAGDVPEERVGVIDCVSHHQAVETVAETDTLKYANSPENLTRIGVKFTELFETFYDDPDLDHTGVGVHSLSQLLMHSDMKKVYQFLQVLTGQVRSAGWLGVAVIDGAVADEQDIQTLQQHFDGMVQTRENEAGRREFRVRGFSASASSWTIF